MKQNLANRLAAGGFWALRMACLGVEISHWVRDQGMPLPPGMDSDGSVFTLCGAEAFKVFCNANIEQARISLQAASPVRTQDIPKYDRYGRRISHEQWERLHHTPGYREVARWHDETARTNVHTVWTGIDPSGCQPPHLFKTCLVRFQGVKPCIEHTFDSHNLSEARMAHEQAVEKVKRGEL